MASLVFHHSYIPKTRAEIISDTVNFFPKQFNMPQISSAYARIHAAQDLIYALQNPAPAIPQVKLGKIHKKSLRYLMEILRKSTPPALPLKVPVRGAYQEKLQQVNQERTQMKMSSQSNPFTNAEPLSVTMVEEYPG